MHLKTTLVLISFCLYGGSNIAATDIPLTNTASPFIDVTSKNKFAIGRATFSGVVIASACNLAMDDNYQTIDMGVTPISELQSIPSLPEKVLKLRMTGCELGKDDYTGHLIEILFEWERVDITNSSDAATGIDLKIQDSRGSWASSGIPLPPQVLGKNEKELDYKVYLTNSENIVHSGHYNFALKFKVNYQ
ncbi:fimbrial protein [Serratia sp. DD3]|uniref:fimbrial protein n=1 Tax=Serratia sp. DD3 TaxID=1410619 RepID=UPI0004D85DB3|nr:type 1 fimbrial protein [Serratia sp. DD3]KEY58129.1 PAP fimbrial minor pilin protein [Serratia sp. DD3]